MLFSEPISQKKLFPAENMVVPADHPLTAVLWELWELKKLNSSYAPDSNLNSCIQQVFWKIVIQDNNPTCEIEEKEILGRVGRLYSEYKKGT